MLDWLRGRRQSPAAAADPAGDLRAALERAFAHHQAGRLEEADAGYREILAADPRHFDALHLSGVLALQAGRSVEAAAAIEAALAVDAKSAQAHNNLGEAYRRLGRLEDAAARFREAVARAPDFADAHFNLAIALRRLGRLEEALEAFRRALAANPAMAVAQVCLGETLNMLGRPAEAVAAHEAAIALKPDYAEAHNALGLALRDAGRLDDALAACQRAVAHDPKLMLARFNVGNLLREKGFLEEAAAAYRAAIELEPAGLAEAHNNLGNVLKDLGRPDEALECYRHALALKPDFAETVFNAASLLRERGRLSEAAEAFANLLAVRPKMAEAHYELGNALKGMGDAAGAVASYRRALEAKPDFAEARWAAAMAEVPMLAESEAEAAQSRARFDAELAALERWSEAHGAEALARAVGVQQPFYLAYQEADHRERLARYGRLCARLMGAWQEGAGFARAARVTRAETRIGIVSNHVYDHSVWNAIVKGWLQGLDRNRYDLRLYHLGRTHDVETALAKTLVAHYAFGKSDILEWVPLILGHQLDVLIYPEVGMDPLTAKLASMRLAPVQAAAWGHPITTGLPTMDYYLSAEALEPADAQAHYTERLVRLPGLGCSYAPLAAAPAPADLAALGVRQDVPVLVCAGTPFKYAPRQDAALAAIARRLGECQFVFFTPGHAPELMARLRARLARGFAAAGLDLGAFAAFVPWQNRVAFYGLMAQSDVFLDTMGFSGFNTAMQAIECGLPVAAFEGRYLRGRLASGVLRRMGLDELVATDDAGYVEIAVRLATDAAYWGEMRARIEAARGALYHDRAPVRALEQFFAEALAH
jgi:predicted O-linked N-acetylglucosamine transferase (SPINDLY family)